MNPSPPARRSFGFRMSWLDALILMFGAFLSWWLMNQSVPCWWIVPVALGHFFLFCNVFLVWRRWELLWAGTFVFNVAAHLAFGELGWLSPLLFQLPVTVLVITWQIRSPWYHGIFAEKWNRQFKEYLADHL